MIRAWDVVPLSAAAQFNSIWKALDDSQQDELQKEAKAKKVKLSEKGFADAPAVFRKVSQAAEKHMHHFRDGSPNPERRILGGIVVNDRIERDVTINLVALRAIRGGDDTKTEAIRRYLLSLALLAATADIDMYLREGCHLRYSGDDDWKIVPRRGGLESVDLPSKQAQEFLHSYAEYAARPFKSEWPAHLVHTFDLKEAKKLLPKTTEDEEKTT